MAKNINNVVIGYQTRLLENPSKPNGEWTAITDDELYGEFEFDTEEDAWQNIMEYLQNSDYDLSDPAVVKDLTKRIQVLKLEYRNISDQKKIAEVIKSINSGSLP